MQTFTFYCSEDKLELSGNVTNITVSTDPLCYFVYNKSGVIFNFNLLSSVIQGAQINNAACNMAREVASEGDALVAGGVSQTPCYLQTHSEVEVKSIFKKQMDDFLKKDIDFFIAEV